jgi:hypothetical protein
VVPRGGNQLVEHGRVDRSVVGDHGPQPPQDVGDEDAMPGLGELSDELNPAGL